MMAIIEEIARLAVKNDELKKKNEESELMLVSLESLKQDNEYLRKNT